MTNQAMRNRPGIGRILLALDISPRSRLALAAAAELAAKLDAELAGLFVEDLNLLRLSALPFAREFGSFSSVARPIALAQVQRALRREAAEVEQQLAQAASRLRLRWTFQVLRGQIAAELFAQAGEYDLVVLGKRSRSGVRGLGREMAGLPRGIEPGPVLVVFDGSAGARRALELAAHLAQAGGAQLRLLIPAESEEAYLQGAHEARAALAYDAVTDLACRRIPTLAIATLAAAARAQHCGALVLSDDGHLRSAEGYSALLDEVDCPVLLVR